MRETCSAARSMSGARWAWALAFGSVLATGALGSPADASAADAPPGRGATWTLDLLVATAANANSRLTIRQAGYPDLDFDADWSARPFEQPLLWSVRIARERARHAWALEFHHHKLDLENPPPEVESFSISHGTNFITAQHAWLRPRWRFFALAGVAAIHPESTVRGERLPEYGGPLGTGHSLSGPVLGGGVGAHVPLARRLHLTGELRVTCAWLRADIAGGDATTRNLAIHLPIGVRLRN